MLDRQPSTVLLEECYSCFDLIASPLSSTEVLVYSASTNLCRVLPIHDAELLLFCKESRALSEHAEAYCMEVMKRLANTPNEGNLFVRIYKLLLQKAFQLEADIRLPQRNLKRKKLFLARFAEEGLLLPTKDLKRRLKAIAEEVGAVDDESISIDHICIPTANRPESLERAISSFGESCRQYGHRFSFLVVDDSDDPAVIAQNREHLRSLKERLKCPILHADRDGRRRHAAMLAQHTCFPKELLEFAIVGQDNHKYRVGALRNYALLQTIDHCCLMTDDDTICTLVAAPQMRDALQLGHKRGDPYEEWYFLSVDDALRHFQNKEVDLLSIHQVLLGKLVSGCIETALKNEHDVKYDASDPTLLGRLVVRGAAVKMSFVGILGDSGGCVPLPRLLSQGNSFKRLTNQPEHFRTFLTTRAIFRSVSVPTIGGVSFCMTMNVGIDNRKLLPPFMPVLRPEDHVFGTILKAEG